VIFNISLVLGMLIFVVVGLLLGVRRVVPMALANLALMWGSWSALDSEIVNIVLFITSLLACTLVIWLVLHVKNPFLVAVLLIAAFIAVNIP
jgi:hypothetical protein